MTEHDPLWNKLKEFRIGTGGESLGFTQRLARDNGWTDEYANRVFNEYLRFIYLTVTSHQAATPSDEIDQAWHLHLSYTKSYWKDLCHDLLGTEIHHNPTKGGVEQAELFYQQYEATLQSYRNAFGGEPPLDIWPKASDRFNSSNRYVRINRRHTFTARRRTAVSALVVFFSLSILGLLLLLFGPSLIWDHVAAIGLAGVILLILVTLFIFPRSMKTERTESASCGTTGVGGCASGCGSGCGGCGS